MTTAIQNLQFPAPGYERLWEVLKGAHDQAAIGKGKVRHASGEPFHEQPIVLNTKGYGLGFATGQAAKKVLESHRLDRQAAIHELRGAINYIAAAIIALEDMELLDEVIRRSSVAVSERSGNLVKSAKNEDMDLLYVLEDMPDDND